MKRSASLLVLVPWLLVAAASAAEKPIFDVPQLGKIRVDGDPADWGESGFRVSVLTNSAGQVQPAADLDAGFRLGWDKAGLLLLLTVTDDVNDESDDEGTLWTRDSIELMTSKGRGEGGLWQVILSPGLDPDRPELRRAFYDQRSRRTPELRIETARRRTTGGYILEARLPWKNLAVEPRLGTEVGFQLYVNDTDGGPGYPDGWFRLAWFPSDGSSTDASAEHRVRLAAAPSPPVLATASGGYENLRRTRIEVHAAGALAGRQVKVQEGDVVLVSGSLQADGHRSAARLILPMPGPGQTYGPLRISVDEQLLTTLDLPSPDEQRARLLMDLEVHCDPAVFDGPAFPSCGPTDPARLEELIGPNQVRTTFFDRTWQEVAQAEQPGRYGAVIELVPEQGRVVRRFRTLFRSPAPVDWWGTEIPVTVHLPSALGLDSAVVAEQARVVNDYLKGRLMDGLARDDRTAPLLAGLYESQSGSGDPGAAGDVMAQDRQWWVGLKRRLYGMGQAYPDPLVCPRPVQGPPAPVVRAGTPAAAGFKPEAIAKIDALCREWAAASDQGFAVCLVRRGVVVLHQAYGQRDGRPMTVDDPSWMASITKLLSGTLMMMLVDQGRVDLDAPVDRYVPALRSIQVKTPLTVRHLYTHTNGLWGHWGDDLSDFEEILADYYPYLEVGVRHSYNGAGYALAGKVIEATSGEAIPQFYRDHLLTPLGCTRTRVTNNSWDAASTPMEIARIGQMLLNRGAYGDLRFFGEETFARMMPERLTRVLGPEAQTEWGIGAVWYKEPGLGAGTFGHGAASSATLRIDPAHDLVIVMTRNAAGSHFEEYHPRFLAAVVEGLE